MRLVVLLSLLLFAGQAHGQCVDGRCVDGRCPSGSRWSRAVQPRTAAPARHSSIPVVRIHDRNGSVSIQSGCVVRVWEAESLAVVATAAHGFTSDSTKVAVWVSASDGYEATIKQVDHKCDLALLLIRRPPGAVAFPLATRFPVVGQVLWAGGNVAGRTLRWVRGALLGGVPHRTLRVQVHADSGQSGGPILTSDGRLLGLISAGDATETFGPSFEEIAAALAELQNTPEADELPDPEDTTGHVPDYDSLLRLIKQNAVAIAELATASSLPGPPGATGEPGPPGARGPKGDSVDFANLSDDQLQILIGLLPPVVLQTINAEGDVIQEATHHLGGTPLKLRLVPVRPKGA